MHTETTNQTSYNWNAHDYLKHSQAQYDWAKELINKLHLQGMESVLDIGCGDGKVTNLLSTFLPQGEVIGIDSSASMIALAQKNFPTSKYPNLTFIQMDALKLNFKDRFDIVFSNAALHWIKDHTMLLRQVKKNLKDSGKILFQMGGKGNAQDVIEVVNQVMSSKKWKPYFQHFQFPYAFYSPPEYEHLLKEAGFILQKIELIPKVMTHKGKEGLAGWIRTTWLPYTERIPERQLDYFIDDVVNLYMEKYDMDTTGIIGVKMMRLEVEAFKP